MSKPPYGYRLASLALALPFIGYTLVRATRDGGWRYLRERLGWAPRRDDTPLWVHCASVGEVIAALPLVRELATHGHGPLLLTTNTPTGRHVAEGRAPADVDCAYLPLDRPAPVRRFLARTRPQAGVILETELWPWLFAAVGRRGIPLALVNARLSARTLRTPRWLRAALGQCLQGTAAILARSDEDAQGFRDLGAIPERVRVIGNIKFAAPIAAADDRIELGRPFVLAASTHDDEELQLAAAWSAGDMSRTLLVIAPRHPGRGESITDRLHGMGLAVARRSRGDPVTDTTDVYLADTLGELPALIAGAELVIIGGSLIPRGGQNVLEPARAARAILTGPHMDNFRDETAALVAAGGLRQCADAGEVASAARELLADPVRRGAMGERAAGVLTAGADMAARYREALDEVFGKSRSDSDVSTTSSRTR